MGKAKGWMEGRIYSITVHEEIITKPKANKDVLWGLRNVHRGCHRVALQRTGQEVEGSDEEDDDEEGEGDGRSVRSDEPSLSSPKGLSPHDLLVMHIEPSSHLDGPGYHNKITMYGLIDGSSGGGARASSSSSSVPVPMLIEAKRRLKAFLSSFWVEWINLKDEVAIHHHLLGQDRKYNVEKLKCLKADYDLEHYRLNPKNHVLTFGRAKGRGIKGNGLPP